MWQTRANITEEELLQYRQAAERAWADDTRHALYQGSPVSSAGQCYVTSKWLTTHLGGFVASKNGHYFWIDPEGLGVIDLTGDQFCYEQPRMASTEDAPYRGFRVVRENTVNARTERFIRRANRELNRREDDEAYKIALDYGGDAFPGETPQKEEDREDKAISNPYWHDEPNQPAGSGTYQFIYANGQLHVSPSHGHDELAGHAQVGEDHSGPIAVGYVNVDNSRATWDVHANISIHALQKVLKSYTDQVGWQWGGLADIEGEPIGTGSEFAPAKSSVLPFRYIGSHLYIGAEGSRDIDLIEGWLRKQAKAQDLRKYAARWLPMSLNGTIEMDDYYAVLRMGKLPHAFKYASEDETLDRFSSFLDAIKDWADDRGLELHVAGNDNLIRNYDFIDLHNLGDPNQSDPDAMQFPAQDKSNEFMESQGVYRCPGCDRLFPSYFELHKHRQSEEPEGDLPDDFPHQNADIPENDADEALPKHFKEMVTPGLSPISNTFVLPQPVEEAKRVDGFETYSKLWDLDEPDLDHVVAYQDGSPVGFASLRDDEIVMMHEAKEGINDQIMSLLQRQHDELKSEAPTQEITETLKHAGWAQASSDYWKWAQGQDPSQMLQDAIPFIYDVDEDSVFVGQPGQRHADIHGQFTPGGIVEGTYEPGGQVLLNSQTDIPYTVRHLLQLWYYQHPELEIKGVSLQDASGQETKLAKSIGHRVLASIAANAAAFRAAKELERLGEVYAVGPVVRDAILGRELEEPPTLAVYAVNYAAPLVSEVVYRLPGSVEEAAEGWLYKQAYSEAKIALAPIGVEDFLNEQDFTVDALAVNTKTATLIDDHDGRADAELGLLIPLRPAGLWQIRAMRLASFGFTVPENLSKLAREEEMVYATHVLRDTLQGLISADNPSQGIRVAHDLGMLDQMLPEVSAVWNYEQNTKKHSINLGEHLCQTLDAVAKQSKDPDLRLAGLLHDIGKPQSRWTDKLGVSHYYRNEEGEGDDHENVGARMARARLYELGFSDDRIDRISELIRLHMWGNFKTHKGARKFLYKAGSHVEDLFKLRYADMVSKGREANVERLVTQRELIREAHAKKEPHRHADLAISGHDLIQQGMQTGPHLGEVLDKLTQAVIEDPGLNSRGQLLKLAHQYAILEKE